MTFSCILCKAPCYSLESLASHVKGHGKLARAAYKRGYWIMQDAPVPTGTMFDALPAMEGLDSASQSKELEVGKVEPPQNATASALSQAVPSGESQRTEGTEQVVAKVEGAPITAPSSLPPDTLSLTDVFTPADSGPSYIEPKADLVYGVSGSGKTYNLGNVSDYILQKYGKLSRFVSADGGGLGPHKGKADAGQIEFWGISAWKDPLDAMYKAVRGGWPLRLDDPESPIVMPDAGTYEVYGYWAFESLTSWGDKILDNLKVKNVSLSQDPSYRFEEGDTTFAGGNQSYYGFMQDQLQSFVYASHLLGGPTTLVDWTAHENRGESDGAKVYGPMIGGKKATGKAAGWFRNVWHMDIIPGEQTKDAVTSQLILQVQYALFLKTHIDPTNFFPFPCKFRAPGTIAYLVSDKGMQMVEAYKLLDAYHEQQAIQSEGRMSEIKGLKEKLLANAARAKKAERDAADKRAKAAGLLKPMVSVPAGAVASKPVGAVPRPVPVAATPAAPAAAPATPSPTVFKGPVKPAVPLPQVPASIQNVRKGPAK